MPRSQVPSAVVSATTTWRDIEAPTISASSAFYLISFSILRQVMVAKDHGPPGAALDGHATCYDDKFGRCIRCEEPQNR